MVSIVKILQRNINPHLLESNTGKLKDPDCQQGPRAADTAHSLEGMLNISLVL